MRLIPFIALMLFCAVGYAQFPMVGSGRQVYRPDQVDSLFYWFDAQDLATITTTNNKVTQWDDKGPFGYDVVQADTSKAPTYSATSGPGGSTAALTFDGTNDFLASASHFWGSDDLTVFVVMKFGNATRDALEIVAAKSEATTPSNQRQWQLQARPAVESYRRQLFTFKDGGAANLAYVYDGAKSTNYECNVLTLNGTGVNSWFTDGANQSIVNTLSGTGDWTILNLNSTPFIVGATNVLSTPSFFLQGSISEIIVFSRALTNAERQGIEAYLSSKYNIALQNKQKPKVIIQN